MPPTDTGTEEPWNYETAEIQSIDSDELYETRPNRWRGAPSTWRSWTEEDRLLHTALTQSRNQDLSIHLYNASALRRQADGWHPPLQWTSWPLDVDRVPNEDLLRETHDEFDDFTTRRKAEDIFPSSKLEEEITASILRTARARFHERDWTSPTIEGEAAASQDPKNEMSAALSDSSYDEPAKNESDEDSGSSTSTKVKRDSEMPFQSAQGDRKVDPEELPLQPEASLADTDFRPVVAADDDLSFNLLRPSVRHILSQLDATLNTLHHSRLAGVSSHVHDDDSASDASLPAPSTPKRRATKPRARSRASLPRDASQLGGTSGDEGADDDSGAEELSSPERRGRSPAKKLPRERSTSGRRDRQSRRDRGERVGRWALRDWREVLGAAALSGFDAEVVARAAERCANLFGEKMDLLTMEEGRHEHTVTVCEPGNHNLAAATPVDGDSSEEERYVDEARRRKRLRAMLERRMREKRAMLTGSPQPGFVSDDEGFKTADETQSRLPSRDPSQGPGERLLADPNLSHFVSDINKIEVAIDGLYYCPIPYCKRHEKGFPLKRGLREHFKLTHDQPTAETGVFYCPFVRCQYHTKSFKTRKNLRAHVKNMHRGDITAPDDVVEGPDPDAMDVDRPSPEASPQTNGRKGAKREDLLAIRLAAIGSEDEMDGGVHVDGFLKPIKIRQGWLSKGGRREGQRNKKLKMEEP